LELALSEAVEAVLLGLLQRQMEGLGEGLMVAQPQMELVQPMKVEMVVYQTQHQEAEPITVLVEAEVRFLLEQMGILAHPQEMAETDYQTFYELVLQKLVLVEAVAGAIHELQE
jgi:hypothetical protein